MIVFLLNNCQIHISKMFVYSFNILASSHILSQRYLDNKDAFQELASVSSVLKKMPLNICLK